MNTPQTPGEILGTLTLSTTIADLHNAYVWLRNNGFKDEAEQVSRIIVTIIS